MKLPWLLRLIWNPIEALDLHDEHGRPDHGKVMPAVCLVWLLVLVSSGHTPPLGVLIALASLSFGYAGWRAFLRSRSAGGAGKTQQPPSVRPRDEREGIQEAP